MPKVIRPIRVEGQLAYVPLTQGYEVVIDAADVSLIDGWNWRAKVDGNTTYAISSAPQSGGRRGTIKMHRVIMRSPVGLQVDHVNGNGLDNRRLNLRAATHGENQRNQVCRRSSSSGFKGVTWNKSCSKWQAQIKMNDQNHYLGIFATREQAAAAYAEASARLHGAFGRVA